METTFPAAAKLLSLDKLDTLLSPQRALDPRILALPPHTAISFGYVLWKASAKKRGSCARREAREAVRDMKKVFASFEPTSPEGLYLLAVRQSAISFANGIRRRKTEMFVKLKEAKTERDRFTSKVENDQFYSKLFSGGTKLLLLGGFTVWLLKWLVFDNLVGIHEAAAPKSTGGLDAQHLSLIFTVGCTLVGAWLGRWWTGRTVGNAIDSYTNKLESAYRQYGRSVKTEYRFAANEAKVAWDTLTQMPAPTTPDFDELLTDLICGSRRKVAACKKDAVSVAKKLGWKARVRVLCTGA